MKELMKPILLIVTCLALFVFAQEKTLLNLQNGANFITTKIYTAEDDSRILKLFEGLRVADVSDGMDMVGLPGAGLVDHAIHADWLDLEDLSHQFRGIAVTARYVSTQRPDRPKVGEKFQEWEGNFYNSYSDEAFAKVIRPGSVVVLDDVEEKDIGSIGSYNILAWHKSGAVGVVTDASARDTDEIAKEKVPLYLRRKGRGIRPGRNELESVNRPVVIGGVLVCPGDVVVADGDGVIVVPRNVAEPVAKFARKILEKDKAGRRDLYESLGRPLDQTVK
ncbi:MAG: RraA family protein [Candidatus Marinimicrobia bacterium]|nr:RraA family protein [Candidatus Neomarinimicrobiota bacterium]